MPPKRGRGRGRGQPRREEECPPQQEQLPQAARGAASPRRPQEVHRPQAARGRPSAAYVPERPEYREQVAEHAPRPSPPSAAARQPPPPSPKAEPSEVPRVEKALAGISLGPSPYQLAMTTAKRPGYGTLGKPIALEANYFLLRYKDINIYHYDVDIRFVRTRPKESAAVAGKPTGPLPQKGRSILGEGITAKEAAEKGVSHAEHQMKRAPGKQRCREVIAEMIKSRGLRKYNPVYDGQKNIYTTKPFPVEEKKAFTITLDEDDRYKDFEVIIQPVVKKGGGNIISLEPLRQLYAGRSAEIPREVVMAFETVMAHREPPLNQVQVGRSFFLRDQREAHDIGEGIAIWFGYNQSVHLTERGPAVIVNFAAKAFHKAGSVINYVSDLLERDILKQPQMEPRDIKMISDHLSKVRVQVTHLPYPRKYMVKSVTRESARDLRFNADGKDVTVAQYFQQKYKPLRYPFLPCLHMRGTNKQIYIPFEVCEVVANQPKLGKLSGTATAKMIRGTAIQPRDRFAKIEAQTHQIMDSSGAIMEQFGLLMDLRFTRLQGRVLPPPALAYKPKSKDPSDQSHAEIPDQRGVWTLRDRDHGQKQQFLRSVEDCRWMIISFASDRFCPPASLQQVADTLCRCSRDMGLNLAKVSDIRIHGRNVPTRQALKYAKDSGVHFALVVLSSRDPIHSYEEVKSIADIELHLVTQCMADLRTKKFTPDVATNILLKVNAKVGGVSHALLQKPLVMKRPMIIMGADAAHSPRGFACPSIAAVVGSLDAFPSRYTVCCRTQTNPDEKKLSQEIIVDMQEMVSEVLRKFLAATRGKYPEKIIFFRDGVSEGQFTAVMEYEVPRIQQACNETLNGNIPPITFVVVQKRHQTRLRPVNPRDGIGRMGNVPPGTTVDREITHPVYFDFFLCSHEGIQGTSKPAHYTVLFDENGFSADELQKLCYHLCHTYVRCNRSISVPAPVMYADLACTRAKTYADLALKSDTQSTLSSGSSGERKLPPEVEDAIRNMGNFDPGMFFV